MNFLIHSIIVVWLWSIPIFWIIYLITGYPSGMNMKTKDIILASVLPIVNTLMVVLQIQDIYYEHLKDRDGEV